MMYGSSAGSRKTSVRRDTVNSRSRCSIVCQHEISLRAPFRCYLDNSRRQGVQCRLRFSLAEACPPLDVAGSGRPKGRQVAANEPGACFGGGSYSPDSPRAARQTAPRTHTGCSATCRVAWRAPAIPARTHAGNESRADGQLTLIRLAHAIYDLGLERGRSPADLLCCRGSVTQCSERSQHIALQRCQQLPGILRRAKAGLHEQIPAHLLTVRPKRSR